MLVAKYGKVDLCQTLQNPNQDPTNSNFLGTPGEDYFISETRKVFQILFPGDLVG